jgi:hypothetical protein
MLKDTATFAAKDPKTFGDILRLSVMQSPVKAVGRIGEATWARGNDNYQNDLSNQFFDSYMQNDTRNFQKTNNDVKTGSYDDTMKRIEAFQEHKDILGSMKPDFISDTTFGDAADTISWAIPGPGVIAKGVKGAVKGGAAVGKGVKGARTALAAAKASGFARDASRGFKMGLGMAGGLGTGGIGGVPLGLAKKVNKINASGSIEEGVQNKVKAVYDEVMSFPKNIPGHEDLAGKSFEDVMNIANNTQDTELINLTNTLYQEQNAMAPLTVLDAAQSVSTGAPATLGKTLTQKNLGWMAKHIDPTDVSTHTLSYFTKTKDQLKQHMFGTLRGGAARAGLDSSALEFKRWQDIPDDALEKALSGWDGNFHGVVDSTGNKVPSLGLAWDHIDSLYNGGENTTRNLQAMVQYINASLGAKRS